MKKGKYAKRTPIVKSFAAVMAVVLLIGCAIGGTLAWLTDGTDPVTNTFTASDIQITLDESDNLNLKMIPGWTIYKDPKATVLAGSEDCYLFVKITKQNNFDEFMTFGIEDGWTKGIPEGEGANGVPANVYFREVTSITTDKEFYIIDDNTVTVSVDVTKEDMNALTTATYPKLIFDAYAVQLYKSNGVKFTPAEAWTKTPGYTPPATP